MSDDKPRSLVSRWLLIDAPLFRNPHPTAAGIVTAFACIAVVIGAAALIWLLALFLFNVFVVAKSTEELRNALIAFGAILGAPFLVWRTWVAHVAARANDEQAKIARESLYTTLFTKAVEQLGATREVKETKIVDGEEKTISRTEPNIEVRLGAIYALERIAQDSERDHWPIMETLCSYIRNRAGPAITMPDVTNYYAGEYSASWPKNGSDPLAWMESLDPPESDLQAALTVVGRRSLERRRYEQLRRNELGRRLNYRLDLRASNLSKTDLAGLDFSNAIFDGSSLFAARLEHGQFNFSSFREAKLCFAILERGSFLKARFSQTDARISSCSRADFGGAEFRFADMRSMQLFGAELDGAIISHCQLNYGRMDSADLSDSRLHDNECTDLCLADARLDRMVLSGSDMTSVSGLSAMQLSTCRVMDTVTLPENLAGAEGIEIQSSDRGPYAEPPPRTRPIEVESRFRNLRKKPVEQRISDATYPSDATD